MINENTPDKLAEIIRDTWPQLFYLKKEKQKIDNISITKSNISKEGLV